MVSSNEAMILSLIKNGNNYGYAIEKAIEESNLRELTDIAFSSIYTILNRLRKK